MASLDTCNVLTQDKSSRHLWRFTAGGGQVKSAGAFSGLPTDPLPRKQFTKGWSSLWHKTVNIAWLEPDQVFLTAVKVPKCDSQEELRTMIEFQIERISPLPVAHIVWSFEQVPQNPRMLDEMRTAIVVIASRTALEKRLGELEKDGYQPDRLELPFLHQLLTTPINSDGVWVYPFSVEGKTFCLTAWWTYKTLQTISLAHLTERENWSAEILNELNKVAWAGEVEGWLNIDPGVHLVCDAKVAEDWLPLLKEACALEVAHTEPPVEAQLASLNAGRVARSESIANLLPAERAERYKQELTDRIWMRAVGALIVVYMMVVACYFGWLQYLSVQKTEIQREVNALKADYDKVKEMRAQIAIQEKQISLRYATLNCMLAAAETLPAELTLSTLDFARGQRLRLVGTAQNGQSPKITDFKEALSKYTVDGELLFTTVGSPTMRMQQGGQIQWDFTCEIAGVP